MKTTFLALCGACVLAACGAAFGHHGTGLYDMGTEIRLKGTVKEWSFGSPHTWLWFTASDSAGVVAEWSIESAPPRYLSRQGWSESTLKPGEELTVLISPERRRPNHGILLEVTRSEGTVLVVRSPGSFGRPASVQRP